MNPLQSPSNPSRRLLLALASALPVAAVPVVAAAAPEGDDAELLALVRQFHQHDATIGQFDQARGIPDDLFEAELARWWQALDRVAETPAQTGAGIAAKLSMLRAAYTNDISKEHPRRFALIAGLADDAARGTPMPPVAPEGDAELIKICNRLVASEEEMLAIHATRHSMEDERRTEPDLDVLRAEQETLMEAMGDLDYPSTLAGARAMARASIALAELDQDGEPVVPADDSEWLAFVLAQALAEGMVA